MPARVYTAIWIQLCASGTVLPTSAQRVRHRGNNHRLSLRRRCHNYPTLISWFECEGSVAELRSSDPTNVTGLIPHLDTPAPRSSCPARSPPHRSPGQLDRDRQTIEPTAATVVTSTPRPRSAYAGAART